MVSIGVTCKEFREQENVAREAGVPVGDSLELTLCSNPTTGFRWGSPEISDPCVMAVTGHEFVPPAEDEKPPLTGGAGSEVWTFRALESGQATIGMTYGRPWQRDVEPTWRFALTVVVTAETP